MTSPTHPPTVVLPRRRAVLSSIPEYRPGRLVPGAVKLSSNENPFPPLPGVLESALEAARGLNRYPDLAAVQLRAALADGAGLTPDHVAVGTGSVGVLQQLVQTVAGPGDEVVFPWRSFEAYPIVVQVSGATGVPVALMPSAALDLDAMARATGPRTRMVVLCTPNNPTGPALAHDAVLEFLGQVPGDVLVVVDEAYVEFVQDPTVVRGLDLLRDHPNVCLLRTFSKAYGLAGLRVGFALAHPDLAATIRACAVPFGVSTIAQAAALESLSRVSEMQARVAEIVVGRRQLQADLRDLGWAVPDSEANFVWLPLGGLAAQFALHCEEGGVVVRAFPDEGVRVTVGTADENARFLDRALAWPPRT